MCFDPVSLGLLAAGTAASVGGGMLTRGAAQATADQQQQDNLNAAAARNAVLQQFLAKQAQYQQQNKGDFQPVVGAIDPATFQATQAADTAGRTTDATTAINGVQRTAAPISNTDPGVVGREIATRSADATGKSVRDATNDAKLKGFGDVFSNLGLTMNDAARKIDTTNSFARGDAALLQSQQDLASAPYQIPRAPVTSPWGSALSGIGNVFATAGGSGMGARVLSPTNLGNVFAMSPAQQLAAGVRPV